MAAGTPESSTRTREVPAGYVSDLFRLDGQTALVTGGAQGLGEAIATGLAQAGAQVVIGDIDLDRAQELVALVTDVPLRLAAVRLDVSSRASVEDVVAYTTTAFGPPDILVNAAGISTRHAAEDFPEDVWDRIIAVNLKGSFLMAQACGRLMLDRRSGSIINLASIGASVGFPGSTAYLQSKGGVAQLTRSLAVEWADRDVRVNAIAPCLFNTPMIRAIDVYASATSTFITDRTPMGRRGEPHEVVGAALFLASRASAMVTGHLLQVDGGYVAA